MKGAEIAELLLLAALWGGSFLFMRIAAPVLGPIWLIEFRVLLAAFTLLPILIRRNLWHEVRQNWTSLFLVGCFNSALPFSLLAFASVSLPAGFTSILNATTPLFGTLVAFVWFKERITIARAIGFILGFAGVMILIGWKPISATPGFVMAVLAGLLAAFTYASAAPYIKQRFAGVSSIAVTAGTQLGAALGLLPALLFTIPQRPVTAETVIAVLALALLSTAFAYILYFRLIQQIGATKTLTVAYLIPLFAILWGALVLQEAITESLVLGGSLVLLGTAIANDLFQFKWLDRTRKP